MASAASIGSPGWARHGMLAALLLAASYGVVLLVAGVASSGELITAGPPPLVLAAARLEPLRGQLQRLPDAVVIHGPDAAGLAIVAAQVPPLAAADYRRLAWRIRGAAPGATPPMVVWRTRESPNRTFSLRLAWIAPGLAGSDLAAEDGWRGTITGLALAVQGPVGAPLAIEHLTLSSPSAAATMHAIVQEWGTFFPFRGNSFTFPFDEERTHVLPLVAATALALILAMLAYVVVARRRGAVDAAVLWILFLAAWLVLDARWQVNLWQQLARTGAQFAGRDTHARHLAEDDHQIYELMQRLRAVLPPPPARILFLSDNATLRTRGSYFLLPHSVFFQFGGKMRAPAYEQVHAGDHVLLLFYTALAYDPAARTLTWPDGRSRNVVELYAGPDGARLLRVL